MTLEFIKQINEYVIDSIIEASDEEILACVGSDDYPSQQDIHQARAVITRAVKEQRQLRLSQQRAAFQAYKQEQEAIHQAQMKKDLDYFMRRQINQYARSSEQRDAMLKQHGLEVK